MFEDWTAVTGRRDVFRSGKLHGAWLEPAALRGSGAELASDVIQVAGERFGDDFYRTWNGHADVRLFTDGDAGVLAVMDMGRAGDEDGPVDTPTFAWRSVGERVALVGSRGWRDTSVVRALDVQWPEREQFVRHQGVQGWGE